MAPHFLNFLLLLLLLPSPALGQKKGGLVDHFLAGKGKMPAYAERNTVLSEIAADIAESLIATEDEVKEVGDETELGVEKVALAMRMANVEAAAALSAKNAYVGSPSQDSGNRNVKSGDTAATFDKYKSDNAGAVEDIREALAVAAETKAPLMASLGANKKLQAALQKDIDEAVNKMATNGMQVH